MWEIEVNDMFDLCMYNFGIISTNGKTGANSPNNSIKCVEYTDDTYLCIYTREKTQFNNYMKKDELNIHAEQL